MFGRVLYLVGRAKKVQCVWFYLPLNNYFGIVTIVVTDYARETTNLAELVTLFFVHDSVQAGQLLPSFRAWVRHSKLLIVGPKNILDALWPLHRFYDGSIVYEVSNWNKVDMDILVNGIEFQRKCEEELRRLGQLFANQSK